jgi:unsaturated rhamnogalacturonyl hydrolase
MMKRIIVRTLSVIVFCLSLFMASAQLAGVSVADTAALTLANGVYGNIINGQSFQQDALLSYKGWQYMAWYNASRQVCIGRRKLPAGAWEIIAFTDYHFSFARNLDNDAHNTISIGMCAKDGTLHMAFDHHASDLHYRVSQKQVLGNPAAVKWDASLFSPVLDYLEEGKPLKAVTYPCFTSTPAGNLLFSYRRGGSNNASYYIGQYNGSSGTWKNIHPIISGEGDYKDPYKGVSKSRNAYLNGVTYDGKGRLHITWVWRELAEGVGNRDICYAYSKDDGNTWYNTFNQVVATADGKKVMNTFTPGITIKTLDRGWGNMNSQSQTVDNKGVPHTVMYHRTTNSAPEWARFAKDAAYFHYYRKADGNWQQVKVPAIGNRPKLVTDKQDNLYLLFMQKDHFDAKDQSAPLVIYKATAAKKWTDWQQVFISGDRYFNEPQVDLFRWQQEGVLSVLVQDAPASTGAASAIKVLDVKPVDMMTDQPAIKTVLRKVADWQIDSIARKGFRWPVNEWVYGTFYKGLWKTGEALNEQKYLDTLVAYGNKTQWKVGAGERRYFADDYCLGEVYCVLYKKYKQPHMIADFRQMADELVAQPHTESLEYKNKIYFREWAWCDALFMGPASLAALSNLTNDKRYLVLTDTFFRRTHAFLYDREEHLFFRDSRFFTERESNGAKKFWGRGNGWVLAGLARLLENMPANHASRKWYEQLFVEMAQRIASIQQPDGMWRASLLNPASYPGKETSGTGFYCYAMAWGINNNLLDKATYYPVVQKAWNALNTCVHPDGKLGFVQMIADKPGVTGYDNTEAFGVGGFLLAGTEILKMKH